MTTAPDALDAMLATAHFQCDEARNGLDVILKQIGMTRSFYGQDVHQDLHYALQRYVTAEARRTMLEILSTEDFFVAMSRSAGRVSD